MKILVTGSAGFLGSWVAERMLDLGHDVVGVDNLVGGSVDNVDKRYDLTYGDVCDLELMTRAARECEVVYHCAALAYEGLSVFSPSMVVHNIVGGTVTVATAAIQAGARRFVNCSSMARYGEAKTPYEERFVPRPVDPYGLAKLQAEQQLNLLGEIHGMEVVHLVPHNIYGPRQKYDDPFRNVASIFANSMLQGKRPRIYGDGKQVRCFSYIADVLPVFEKVLDCPLTHLGEVFNVGPDEGAISIDTLYTLIACKTDFYPRWIYRLYEDPRPCEVKHAVCSSQKIREAFGIEPNRTLLSDGIQILVEDIRRRGPKPFVYHLPIEIDSPKVPRTWKERLI